MSRYEIRIIGFGGQGVISLSKLIINTAVLHEGLLAVQTEAYSASARGGKCWADCVIENDPNETFIDYPRALSPYDFMFVLSDEASKEISKHDLKKGGWLVWDSSVIGKFRLASKLSSLAIPAQELAVKEFGSAVLGSSMLFGAFIALSGVISKDAAIKTLEESVPARSLGANLKAFERGFSMGEARAREPRVEGDGT